MSVMKGLTLTTKEQARLHILNGVLEGHWLVREAAEVLGMSERHTWRILAAYRREGAAALAHGNRGRVPTNTTSAWVQKQVVDMVQRRYKGINHTHLTELLEEREGIVMSRSTVRRLLLREGLSSPRYRRPHHRYRRQRMPQEGMLLQVDGSHHAWLEDRGPVLALLLAVDDATGTVPYALFREQEDTQGYLLLMRRIVQRKGIPLALYCDRHSVFTHHSETHEKDEEKPARYKRRTQFGRALKELGIRPIFARSPQAKGRVERANGTFQDRLVAEMRLAGASSLDDANRVLEEFLLRFNNRFGVPAAQPGAAYREVPEELDVDGVLCVKELRRVAKDNTVQYHSKTLQLFPDTDRTSYARARVEVQERLDGSLVVCYRGKVLTPVEAPPLAAELRGRVEATPILPVDPWPPEPVPEKRRSKSKPKSTLGWEGEWYQDETKKRTHRELVRVGMERARLRGKRIGRPKVIEREGFPQQFEAMVERLRSGDISRRRAAQELDIGYATLKRLLDALPHPLAGDAIDSTNDHHKEVLYYAHASSLTESLTT
jgi:transposase